jgi:hypothetical protein
MVVGAAAASERRYVMRPSMDVTPDKLVQAFHAGEITFNGAAREDPEVAWQAILAMSRQALTDQQTTVLAAGPLEDLLAYHGPAFIDRVEKEARVDRAFRHLLGGVWRSSIAEAVWRRMEAIRGPAW